MICNAQSFPSSSKPSCCRSLCRPSMKAVSTSESMPSSMLSIRRQRACRAWTLASFAPSVAKATAASLPMAPASAISFARLGLDTQTLFKRRQSAGSKPGSSKCTNIFGMSVLVIRSSKCCGFERSNRFERISHCRLDVSAPGRYATASAAFLRRSGSFTQ